MACNTSWRQLTASRCTCRPLGCAISSPDHSSIDPIAPPQDYLATRVEHLRARHQEASLSDHDADVVEVDPSG